MRENQSETDVRIRKKPISWGAVIVTYVVMLLLVGIQVGIIIMPGFDRLGEVFQVALIMGYWALVATVFGLFTNAQIKRGYDKPMGRLSAAAKQVAGGDFSVYLEPLHTPDKYDYIDVMFLDFNTMVQELGSIETLKNDFVSNVSHEIKTPLAIIKNYTTMLKQEHMPEETRIEYIKTIVDATDNLSMLVSNILKLNKLDNQEIEVSSEPFDLCRQLCDCALRFESLWEQKNIEFWVEIEDRAMIRADENMLEIVWNNLLSNALKFTNTGGRVTLTQTSEADSIRVTVSDTGCGMNQATMRHIFDKFYQGDTSHSGEGNGLGLALAARVVDKLGGTIIPSSEPGKGSTFTVTIPLRSETLTGRN